VLIVSGAHSDLVLMEGHRRFRPLGRTIDDAAGEAFDKVARLLGLGFPGGPFIERAARDGDPSAFPLPRAALADRYDFSFSGLKTAVLRLVRQLEAKGDVPVADVAASFQKAITEILAEKTARAAAEHAVETVLLGGGVAANLPLRAEIQKRIGHPLRVPPPRLCTDNGAMIGAAAFFVLRDRGTEVPVNVRSDMKLA
jgi:N6-L-threonylcarbamoyladenine synthase